MSVHAADPAAMGGGFHIRYEGATGVTLSDDTQLLAVNLVRSDGSPAFTGRHLVDMMPQPDLPSVEEHFVASGRQVLPFVGVGGPRAGGYPRRRPRPTAERPAGRFAARQPSSQPSLRTI